PLLLLRAGRHPGHAARPRLRRRRRGVQRGQRRGDHHERAGRADGHRRGAAAPGGRVSRERRQGLPVRQPTAPLSRPLQAAHPHRLATGGPPRRWSRADARVLPRGGPGRGAVKHPREMERRLAGDVVRIGGAEYAGALPADRHVFLVGNLQQPTTYPFIRDERVEVVLVSYRAGDDGRYHWHPDVTEYELVVEGEIGYFEVASGVTHWFAAGDFVAITAGACVKRMVRAPARGVTVKVPPSREGRIDLSAVEAAATAVGRALGRREEYHVVVVKSTVVAGTTDTVVRRALEAGSGRPAGAFGLCMNPEFLREGSAVADFMR